MRDETTETIDTLLDVQQAMALLTERQRQVLGLWGQGYTQQEIGESLGITQAAVCYRLAHAMSTLRSGLG